MAAIEELTFDSPNYSGVEEIFDGPWLCYYDDPTPEKIKTAQDLIFEVVREEGPFDAVLGFSQGAALASSIMLAHARAGRRQNIFGVAILLSPTLPFDVDSGILNLSFNTDEGLKAIRTSDEFGTKFEDITQQDWMTDRRTAGVLAVFDQRRGPRSRTNPDQQSIDVLLRYHASTNPTLKIHVPTVVVLGMKDGYGYDCFDVVELCDARTSRVVKHDGGHRELIFLCQT